MSKMELRLDKFNKEAMLNDNYLEKVESVGSDEEIRLDSKDMLFHDILESNNKVKELNEYIKRLELDHQHKVKMIK